jgi:Protein of unknown function (DUF1822)
MSIFHQEITALTNIYQEHVWISVDFSNLETCLSEATLNQFCLKALSTHLTESLDLVIKQTFPSRELNLPFISKLVNGFVLSISGVKVAFIPSQDLDLMGFEVQREWVELSNWVADYYVPIQIDRAHHCLHLWGFISHQYLLQTATLDRTLHCYEVEGADLIDDMDALWIACDLVANHRLAPEREAVSSLTSLSDSAAKILIDRLQQHQSIFSPRLLLPFEQWGAIINDPNLLNLYANPEPVVTKIANWFRSQITTIENNIDTSIDRGWVTIEDFGDQSTLLPGFFSPQNTKFELRGIALSTEQEIDRAVNNLYANQSQTKKVSLPADIDSPLLLLVYLMQHTPDETLRRQAAEYLWTISHRKRDANESDSHKKWHRKIKDLGLVMQGHKLGLMVAAIPLLDGTYAVLTRVYPIGKDDRLPANVELNLHSETGEQLYRVESRSSVNDNYIQLYFIASVGDRFNISIAMNNASVTEAFVI